MLIEARGPTSNISANLYGSYASTSGAVTSITEQNEMGQLSGTGQGGVVTYATFASYGDSGTVTATRGVSEKCVTVTLALYG